MDYSNSKIILLIEEHIHSERDRAILRRRLVDGITFERMAEEFDLTPRQVRRVVHNCEVIIFKHYPGE